MKLRSEYKDAFVDKHGVKLGLMSGFVKVCAFLIHKEAQRFIDKKKEVEGLLNVRLIYLRLLIFKCCNTGSS